MKNVIISSIVIVTLLSASCKNEERINQQVKSEDIITSTSIKPLLAQVDNNMSFMPKVFYVTASSGLSLRAGSNLNSKKVLTLPYGSEVALLSSPKDTDMVVAGVKGKMLQIAYQGAQGYAFDGYLSSLAPPQIDEDIEDYAKRISSENNLIQVIKKANKAGHNYGMTTTIELPARSWNEMYKISQHLFSLPHSIHPDFNKKANATIIVNKNKRERTFQDELAIEVTKDGAIKSLIYSYKLKDYSRTVTLTRSSNGFKAVEVEEAL